MFNRKFCGEKFLHALVLSCLLIGAAPTLTLAAEADPVPAVIEKTTPSVVAIIGKPSSEEKTIDNNRFNLAHGTGVIVRSDGYIVTNAHVVKDMRNIIVVTSEGKSYSGKTTHFDEESDLALVKIEATGLPAATFASASDIQVGQSVIAIGTPLSFALRNSVTVGIISGMDRSVQSQYQLIQTDAAINPGNSGGALVNMKGQVVGINTLKYVSVGVDGLGFAIPVNTVQYVLDQFFKYGKVKRPYLGLELEESWESVVGLPSGDGLKVSYVQPDSPAAKAEIKKGDILLSVGNAAVSNLVDYNETLKNYLPGQSAALKLQTASGIVQRDVTFEEDPAGASQAGPDQDGAYIDSDQGKTRIGDSHYGWSMNYPSGLVKAKQSDSGDSISFGDSKGEFAIIISVSEKQSEDLSPYGLLQKLTGYATDTVLEKQYVDTAPHPYAKLIGKTDSDGYYQVRAFLNKDRIYYVTLYVDKEENYQNPAKQNSYNDLLDTFQLSFDAEDNLLKDVSVYQNKNTVTTEYGLSLDVPGEWTPSSLSADLSYTSQDGNRSITLRVTSASSGDTLKEWASRQELKFKNSYVEQYREVSGLKETTAAGVPAYVNRFSSTMGDKWTTRHVVYFLKDKYKYRLEISFPKDTNADEAETLVADTLKSLSFNKESLNKMLGFIQDDDDLVDASKSYTYNNATYKYSLRVPEIWFSGGYDQDGAPDSQVKTFSFFGGSFTVEADDRTSLEDALKKTSQSYKKNAEEDADYRYTETDEELLGGAAKKYSLTYKSKNVPYTQTEYVFSRGGITYTVRYKINEAVKTEEAVKRINDCLESMRFLPPKSGITP
ncbi:S1C family serine protease [Paenibacillus hamazuiensis]|uniref:S1C family serine protease n=1 Tax=Paenibacillus hamazuiensis TaxID=2936508 RepID=UPI00200F850B